MQLKVRELFGGLVVAGLVIVITAAIWAPARDARVAEITGIAVVVVALVTAIVIAVVFE